jgi:hypothetical protein
MFAGDDASNELSSRNSGVYFRHLPDIRTYFPPIAPNID